jgi:ankyrin repeat protein
MTKSLPSSPSLENLRKQAKTLLKAWIAGRADAIARIHAAHPRHAGLSKPRLTDCQLVLAREAGFDTWAQLKVAVNAANIDLPAEFVEIACLCHDDPHYDHRSFHARASAMLRDKPWLSSADIWCSAAAGNAAAVRASLDDQPELVDRPGPHGWSPLICACYSRAADSFDAAKVLLDRGADPNAFTMKGNADTRLDQKPRKFTALAGVFGGGSTGLANQPPHPQWRELANALLARRANPADEQALQLNQDASLELLLQHGLKPDATGTGGVTLMGRALVQATRRGRADQVRLLLNNHARTDEKVDGKIAWEHAMRLGRVEIARMLEEHGAALAELDDLGRFVSLCTAGDKPGARAMLDRDPELLARAPKSMVQRAVSTRNVAAVRLALDLGFDPNYQEDNAAIMNTGVLSENEEILRILLAGGASLTVRDPWYDSTGVGWADFFNCTTLRDRLLNERGICLLDALDYNRLDRVPDILARDPAALERPFAKNISRPPGPEDWKTPLVRVVVRGQTDAVRVLIDHGADVTARHPDGRSLGEIARDEGFDEIASLLAIDTLRL